MPATLPVNFVPLLPTEFAEGSVLRRSQFGQGYVQRSPEQINARTRTMTLEFLVRSNSEARSLSTFLNDRGTDPLQWQSPDGVAPELYLAKLPFRKTYIANGAGVGNGVWKFSCEFEWTPM